MKHLQTFSVTFLAWNFILNSLGQTYADCYNEECKEFAKARSRKQTERQAAFDKIREQFQTANQLEESNIHENIVELPFDILIAKLQSRELKAVEVLAAFLDKSINVTDRFNCITEFVPGAMAMAEELDKSPKVKGPLHGLPVCFKDNIDIKGMDSTLGYSRLLYHAARNSAVMVKTFEELGAVPFCKTNVPQTLISSGSGNPIFGETSNPLNRDLSPGGSTSGTACLVAAGALKIGTASDLGGSARIPAHYTGVSGISLTPRRLSSKGIVQSIPNLVGLKSTVGLIADKPETLASVLKLLLENNLQYNYDPLALPITWNSHLFESSTSLRIGYYTTLGIFPAMGDTPKTVLAAKDALEARGHKLVSLENLIDSFEAFDVYSDLLMADNGKHIKGMLKNDEIGPSAQTLNLLMSIPSWKRRFLTRYLPLSDRMRITASAGLEAEASGGLFAKMGDRDSLRDGILKIMERYSLDLIISPVMPFPAPRKDVAYNLFLGTAYSSIWNLVEFPAGTVPFGIESGNETSSYDDENDLILRLAKNSIDSSIGMPIGVQVIGKPYQDELVLRGMIELAKLRDLSSQGRIPQNIDIRNGFQRIPQNIDVRNGFPKKSKSVRT